MRGVSVTQGQLEDWPASVQNPFIQWRDKETMVWGGMGLESQIKGTPQ